MGSLVPRQTMETTRFHLLLAEIRMLRVTHGFEVGEQVEDFVLLKRVEQAGRHERYVGKVPRFDIGL